MNISTQHSEPLIEVRDLEYRYPGAASATLCGLSFSLGAGDIYGFLGPSGAGKSTTQKILYRLLSGYTGTVQVAGREIAAWGPEIYAGIGIGFEAPNLYLKLTGRENLEFALALHSAHRSRAVFGSAGSALNTAFSSTSPTASPNPGIDIDSAVKRLGLQDAVDARVETYSKGMRMRLAFIRAVLHSPGLLFLDEPTSGLDPLWSRQVKDWILELRSYGTAVFITTHSMELADELCDTVGFLVDGRLIAQENPAQLKQRYGSPGMIVQGIGADGQHVEHDMPYEDLLLGPALNGMQTVTRVVNREVSLEQVFLQVTGRSLQQAAS
ncbi:MAG: ABC transporter ATP-binding protein [Spirochaetaceae bacterium]|nr:MAG: ABC transporter ATP-binding protein [Spirochaetaceae bacterium]